MTGSPHRWAAVKAALVETGRSVTVRLRRLARGPQAVRAPDRLLFAPQDLRLADPAVAAEMAAGRYRFGEEVVALGRASPFGLTPPSRAWLVDLLGFAWLRHLRAADTAEARALARALAAEAFGRRRRLLEGPVGREVPVAARRLLALLCHSPLLLTGADSTAFRRLFRQIGRDAARLRRAMHDAPRPIDRLQAAVALAAASLCSRGLERRLRGATRALARELEAQILADGGHLSRNPAAVVDLLLDLLPLRLLFGTRGVEIPPELDRAVDRMLPMLRFFRHGSGELALFNGMGRTPLAEVATLLSQDKVRGRPALHASASGYDRIEAGRTLLLIDTGAVPPLPVSGEAGAGCLSFELSSGPDRIVVNCGAPAGAGPARAASRRTAAHSTLAVGTASSARMVGRDGEPGGWAERALVRRFGPVLLSGPREVGVERGLSGERDLVLSAYHDGYVPAFGATHRRRLRVSSDGGEVEGLDTLAFASGADRGAGHAALLRFHLHPAVRASREAGSGTILIELPSGERWRFGAEGAPPDLEDSISFAVTEGRRPARQITLDLAPDEPNRAFSRRWLFLRT